MSRGASLARRPRGDRGSLPMALLLVLVGMSLSALLVPLVLTQIQSTTLNNHRLRALNAAQAGLDVAIGQIRAANDGSGAGVLLDLPCGPMAGAVSAGGPAQYSVTIEYYDADPRGQTANSTWKSTHRIACYPGGGTDSTPVSALMYATGTDPSPPRPESRRLQGTYTFETTNQNIPGGLIHVYQTATSTDLCLDAGTGSPAAGTNVRMQPCTPGAISQTFAYLSNLNLQLVASTTAALPLGMCLDAGTPQAAGKVVAFRPCAATTLPQQQWSFNDAANFQGTADGRTLDPYCFNVQTQNTPGSFVILSTNCNGGSDNIQTFSPEGGVGAGAAGPSSGQLVNFSEFGRCLDVTNQDVNYAYMIAWPCKQAPDPTYVTWNQRWALPTIPAGRSSGTGTIITAKPPNYCLRSPLSTVSGQYVTVVGCPWGTPPDNLTWTVYSNTGSYATSFIITDHSGYCLQPTDPTDSPPDFYSSGQQISKIVVAACDGSALQKWNAPPSIVPAPPLKDIAER